MQWVPRTFWVAGACFVFSGFVVEESRQMHKNKKNYKNSFAISEKNMRKNKNTETYSLYPKILRIDRKIFGKLVDKPINKHHFKKTAEEKKEKVRIWKHTE